MGYCSKEGIGHNAVTESTKMWIGIDGEVLLLAFLPGLLFLDSYESNVYLFKQAISQVRHIIVLRVKSLCFEIHYVFTLPPAACLCISDGPMRNYPDGSRRLLCPSIRMV